MLCRLLSTLKVTRTVWKVKVYPKVSQSIWASVVIGSKRWLCGVFYRPRREDMVSLDCLEETLHCLHPEHYAGTLLMGDFNADQLQSNAHSKFVIRLSEITDSFGLHQLVKDITRNNPDSILDLVYTTHPDQITDAAAAEKLATSDHYMVTFSSKILTKKIVNPPRKVYQYAKADSVLLNDLILKTDWDSIIIENDVEGTWNAFVETFFVVSMQRYLVLQHVPNQSHGLLLTLRNLFLKNTRPSKGPELLTTIFCGKNTNLSGTKLNMLSKNLIRITGITWLTEMTIWRNFGALLSQLVRNQKIYPLILITSSVRILPKLLKNSMIFSPVFLHIMIIHLRSLKFRIFALCRLVLTWFLTELKKLGADKAVGPDNVSGRMLKMCADSIAPVLARIFNCVW